MFNLSKIACIIFGAAVLLTGCKGKDGDPGPAGAVGATGATGAAGQNLTGNLVGYVTVYDEAGNAGNKAGTTVTIDNQTPALTTTTDAAGRYQFTALKAGTYNLTFSRTGYGTYKRAGVVHVGGDQPTYLGNQGLSAVPSVGVTSLTFSQGLPGSYINYTVQLNTVPTTTTRVYVYFGNSPTLSVGNYLFAYTNTGNSGTTTIQGSASKSTLNSYGLASGSTAYAIAYTVPVYNYSYSDPATGLNVFPSLGAGSSVQSFIVP